MEIAESKDISISHCKEPKVNFASKKLKKNPKWNHQKWKNSNPQCIASKFNTRCTVSTERMGGKQLMKSILSNTGGAIKAFYLSEISR